MVTRLSGRQLLYQLRDWTLEIGGDVSPTKCAVGCHGNVARSQLFQLVSGPVSGSRHELVYLTSEMETLQRPRISRNRFRLSVNQRQPVPKRHFEKTCRLGLYRAVSRDRAGKEPKQSLLMTRDMPGSGSVNEINCCRPACSHLQTIHLSQFRQSTAHCNET